MRIEPLFEALVKADALEMYLAPGQHIHIVKDGKRLSLGREPLAPAALLQIASRSLSPSRLQALGPEPDRVEARHGGESFELEFVRPNGALTLAIRRKGGSPVSTPAAAAAEAVPRSSPPPSVVSDSSSEMAQLLHRMVAEDASDLHLSVGALPVMRIHGEIRFLEERGALSSEDVRRLVFGILDDDVRRSFEENRDADTAYEIAGLSRFRVNVFEDRKGIGAVIRKIPVDILSAEQLGLPQAVLDLCFLTKGLVLVTGPTGSGKSTTLAAMVDHINRNRTDHIITIEDPIEFVHENRRCLVNQRQVGNHTRSFKAALRAALREDPDIVLVGELRDLETISIAIETAETGHLVFGTLHTTTAMATVDRVIDQFPPDQQAQIRVMLADSLKGVIAQVLCKKIGGGRVAALEILLGNPALASLIRDGKTFQIPSIMQTSKRQGMVTINDSLFQLVKQGLVEPKEAWMKAVDKSGLLGLLRSGGIATDFVGEAAAR